MLGLWVGHERHGFDYNDEYSTAHKLKHLTDVINIKIILHC